MRFAPLATLLVFACTATLYADKPTTAPAINDAFKATLERRLPELRFDNVAFSDTIDFLRDVTGASIFVNWKALEAAGIDRNAAVTARLRDVPFHKALTTITDSVGGQGKVAWTVDEGVITITTAENLGKNVVTRTYDVRTLEPWRKNAAPATQPTDAKDPVVGMITGSIAPATWGKTGMIQELNGQLLITATEENHKLIANLLDNLKRLAK